LHIHSFLQYEKGETNLPSFGLKKGMNMQSEEQKQKARDRRKIYYAAHREEKLQKMKKYREENLEHIKEVGKAYQDKNRETLLEKAREYQQEHREYLKEYHAQYYQENKEKIEAKKAGYREDHREEIRAQHRAYVEAHRERIKDWQRAYRESHAEHIKKWRENHAEELRSKRKPAPNQAWRFTPEYKEWRSAVLDRDGNTCKRCGFICPGNHAHHLLEGISNPELRYDLNNGETLCEACHRSVHRKR
jgi:5-methylcytosine-specific restriction endonuclease McrA